MNDRGAKALAAAIIANAVTEWAECQRNIERGSSISYHPSSFQSAVQAHPQETLEQIEEFFLSDWFCLLSDIDGAVVLNTLRNSPELLRNRKKSTKGNGCLTRRKALASIMRKHNISYADIAKVMHVREKTVRGWIIEGCSVKEANAIRAAMAEVMNSR